MKKYLTYSQISTRHPGFQSSEEKDNLDFCRQLHIINNSLNI